MTDDTLRRSLRTVAAARLLATGVPMVEIGRWCDAWEEEAERRRLEMGAAYWEDGVRWILAEVGKGQRPPD